MCISVCEIASLTLELAIVQMYNSSHELLSTSRMNIPRCKEGKSELLILHNAGSLGWNLSDRLATSKIGWSDLSDLTRSTGLYPSVGFRICSLGAWWSLVVGSLPFPSLVELCRFFWNGRQGTTMSEVTAKFKPTCLLDLHVSESKNISNCLLF